MSFNFEDALDTKANAVEKPPVMPQGNYLWQVSKPPKQTISKNGEWGIVEFPIKALEAEEDVDPNDLEAFGSLSSAFNRIAFMYPTAEDKGQDREKTLYRLTQFLTNTLAVDCDEEATVREMLANAINCQFYGTAVWRQVDEDTFVDVKNTTAVG